VLLLGEEKDASGYRPAAVQRYLEAVGVPLFVWSVAKSANAAEGWGHVTDVSTNSGLTAATDQVREELASQEIVWLAASPAVALRASVKDGCGVSVLAKW
jgi:hypothetical protein